MKRDLLILCTFFIVTRLCYKIIGVHFDDTPLLWFFQILDPHYLQTDLVRSLFYLHSQPPGFNLFLGIVLAVFKGSAAWIFARIFEILGLSTLIVMYVVGRKLGIQRTVSLLIPMFFFITPPAILFENWLFYTFPVMSLLAVSALLLHLYATKKRGLYGFLFFTTLAGIVCTRTLFHILWFLLITLLVIFATRAYRKKTLLCAFFPLLVILGLHAKNYLLFQQLTLSSWFGMNITKMTLSIPQEKITPLIENKAISPIAGTEPFQDPKEYEDYVSFNTKTGVPVLDQPYKTTGYVNFNHISYITISRLYQETASALIKRFPEYYVLSVAKALYKYLRPCSDSTIFPGNNRYSISGWVIIYEHYLIGNVLSAVWTSHYTNRYGQQRPIHLNFLYFYIPIILFWSLYLSTIGNHRLNIPQADTILYQYMTLNIFYVTCIGNLFEMSENMRFRFLILPFIYLFIMSMFKYFFNKKR